jgi:glycosyltransferase involved in cell wall biosynthesis
MEAISITENRSRCLFSSLKEGFKWNFKIEGAPFSVAKDKLKLRTTNRLVNIYFTVPSIQNNYSLLVIAEVESQEKSTLRLKYKTKSEPFYSDKKSYSRHVSAGRQLMQFSLITDHLSGELCFELAELRKEFVFRSLEIFSNANPRREKSMVSVVIPCYNQGEFLDEALEGLNGADKGKFEVIIVNDGSDDPPTLEKFRDLELKGYFIVHQENKGLGAARNEGIRHAKGNYILPLDCDNKIRPVYIERGIEILDMHPDQGVVYGDVQRFGDSDEIVRVPEFDPKKLIIKNCIDACAVYRKEIWEQVGGYEEKMKVAGYEDWAFWLDIAATKKWNFFHLDEIAFEYRMRSGSMVTNTKRYHEELANYMFVKNIDFIRLEYHKLYQQKSYQKRTLKPCRNKDYDTVLGCMRIHLNHFLKQFLKNQNLFLNYLKYPYL